jgi:hypothetical protein
MAIIHANPITKGLSGSLGRIVFRQLRNKTILANKPAQIKKQSEQQRKNRTRFKAATYWAKAIMLDPEKKAYYWRKAKKLELPNAYTAAVCDYMRKGEIREIDTRQYKGKAGDVIRIKVNKKDFSIHKVEAMLLDADGKVIEGALAIKKDDSTFFYKTTVTFIEKASVTIRIRIFDHYSNTVEESAVKDFL